tara:strand:+ start:498 stop:1211 length:714 start_codon:yes stop_codon:yes gene_type:complete
MEIRNRPRDIFANIVSEEFGQPWWDNAKVGGSNDRIWRTTMDDMIRKPAKLAIICWSGINRFEYLDDHNTWRSAVWVKYKFDKKNLKISEQSETHFHPRMTLKQWKAIQGWAIHVRSMRYNIINTFNHMISIKYFLESKNIPYLFYNLSDGQIQPTLKILDEQRMEGANNLWEVGHMKLNDYLDELPHLQEEAFYDMCKREQVPFGPKDHPLEEGHKLMAERIIGDIYDKKLDKVFS